MLNRVFVYGTLKVDGCNHGIVQPFVKSICAATMRGIIYDLPVGYPAAIDGDGQVIGQVIELNDVEAALAVLDRLEDYYGPECDDNLYDRVIRRVILLTGEEVSAYVYLWRRQRELMQIGKLLSTGEWK